jgi:hypothetical protein
MIDVPVQRSPHQPSRLARIGKLLLMTLAAIILVPVAVGTLLYFAYDPVLQLVLKPPPFNYAYYESFSDLNAAVSEANSYLHNRYPQGSELEAILKEFRAAGAQCGRGIYMNATYYECDYTTQSPRFLPPGKEFALLGIMVRWSTVITPSSDERGVQAVRIMRYTTGL